MIIDNTYFKNEIYIPHAKPGATDDVTSVEADIVDFINEYTRDCLIKSLGLILFYEFESMLDSAQANGLDVAADVKWDYLLNGNSYTDPVSGKTVTWKGIRFKSIDSGNYDRSFLANYVYFYYEQNDYITSSDAGHVIQEGENSITVAPTQKVVKSWRTFFKLVQGNSSTPNVLLKNGMYGVDFYGGGEEVYLYKFIKDSNTILENTYADFNPKTWNNINRFGI